MHLTLTADFPAAPWRALTAGMSITEEGRFVGIDQRTRLMARADAGEVRSEFRAQIERVLGAGVQPTHLDWHCLADGGREDIFELTLELADEYGTGIRAWTEHGRSALRTRGLVAQDQPFLDIFTLPLHDKEAALLDRIRQLPVGLSKWAIHPAEPHPDDPGAGVRLTDYEFLLAASTRQTLQQEQIVVRGYGDPELRTLASPMS